MAGDAAFGPLIWFIQGSIAFISEYHIGEIYFLVPPNTFQSFRLVPLLKRWLFRTFAQVNTFIYATHFDNLYQVI